MNSEYDDIKDGFNAGYVLRKHEPDLAKQLAESYKNVEGDYFKAFISGTKEYAREMSIERSSEFPGFDTKTYPPPPDPPSQDKDDPGNDFEK